MTDHGNAAMEKERVEINTEVKCPQCGWDDATIRFSRKDAFVKVECDDCGIVEDEVVYFGAGAEVGA